MFVPGKKLMHISAEIARYADLLARRERSLPALDAAEFTDTQARETADVPEPPPLPLAPRAKRTIHARFPSPQSESN